MTKNELRSRRTFAVPVRLLSVTALVALLASLLLWHAQAAELLGYHSGKDDTAAPVMALDPNGSPPPEGKSTPGKKPSASSEKPKPKKSSSSTHAGEETQYSEESIEGLSQKLRTRLKRAMDAASDQGVTIRINSGRRSAAKQRRLLQEAIEKYGSYEAATRWVLPPEKSMHVRGKAVDIGPQAAMDWLNENGWKYGICRRYDNEPWHFEALAAPGTRCPARESSAAAESG